MEIKDILKNRRIELHLTMKQVADLVGVSEGTISRWESGDIANMRRDKIGALANALQISPTVIMEMEDASMIMTIGSRVKTRREELGLTQTQLAQLTGYSDKTIISKIEKGDSSIPVTKINRFARVLEVTEGYLMGLEGFSIPASIGLKIMNNPDLQALYDAASNSRPEDIKLATEILRRFKESRNK